MRFRSQFVRRSVAVLAGLTVAGGAVALSTLQAGAATAGHSAQVSSTVAAAPTISIKSDKTTAKAWAKVSFTGKTTGIAAGTKVQVQRRLVDGQWANFPATTKVTSRSTYSVWVQSGRVGVNQFRVVTGTATSTVVSVNVVK